MQVNTLALQHLFEKNIQYRVPLYQRPYVWNEEDQWQYLWEDIRRLADAALSGEDTGYHFLGATVQDKESVPPGTQETRLIIDGQQRLTTLQIIAKAFHDAVLARGDERYSGAARPLAFNSHSLSTVATDAYKVWPTNADREAFQRVMDATSPADLLAAYNRTVNATFVEEAIPDAYLYFFRKMSEWLGAEQTTDRINALYVTLREKLRLVVIDLDQGDDAQMIFETLNARGTPLLAADLIKNSLLAELQNDRNAASIYERYWKPFDIDQGFWREEIGRGHARRARIESFIQHCLTLMSGEEAPASELYTAYKHFGRSKSAGSALDRLTTFRRYGDIYRRLVEQSDAELRRFLYRLDALDVGTAYPFLIALLDKRPGEFALIRNVCERIESFLVRRMICRLNTRGYNKFFLGLIEAARSQGDTLAAIESRLLSSHGENERWPDDNEFERAWLEIPAYASLTRARLRMVLEALEESMRAGGRAESEDCPRNLTIEHILPQAWEVHWPLPAGGDAIQARFDRERRLHSIGNLTLLTDKLSKEQSNLGWVGQPGQATEGKRAALKRHAVLHLNKMLDDAHAWDEAAIADRNRQLFSLAKGIWARPSA